MFSRSTVCLSGMTLSCMSKHKIGPMKVFLKIETDLQVLIPKKVIACLNPYYISFLICRENGVFVLIFVYLATHLPSGHLQHLFEF